MSQRPDDPTGPDLSELDGLTYACLDGCALCCLCQPELLPDEESRFRADPGLSRGIADRHISPDVDGAALRLQGEHGACHFLRGKRCSIYGLRPHYCRAFPLSVFAGWRIQVNANLSCRGMGLPGEDLRATAQSLLARLGDAQLREELAESRKVFGEFSDNMRGAKVDQSVPSLRAAADALMAEFTDELGLSRVLTYAESGSTRQNSSPQDIARRARGSEPEADIHDLGMSLGTELFDLPDLSYLPVYVDEGLEWRIFKLGDEGITGYVLHEDGRTEKRSCTAPDEVSLLPLTDSGRQVLGRYLRTVNARDCFVGQAAHILDLEEYTFNFAQAYLGALGQTAVDLWWRSSFLAGLRGAASLDGKAVREGVVFFDMDMLDQPTIGAFL